MSRRIMVLGNSHTEAIESAARSVSVLGSICKVDIIWLKTPRHGRVELNDALEIIRELKSDDILAITYLGSMHNNLGMFEHERPIGIIYCGFDAGAEDYEIIPAALMRQHFMQRVSEEKLINRIVKLVGCRIVHFPPPPPKRILTKGTKQVRRADGSTFAMKFAQPALRLAIREIELEAVNAYLKQLGVTVLPTPAQALDKDGFLEGAFASSDMTHANVAYGNLVLEQIFNLIPDGITAAGGLRS